MIRTRHGIRYANSKSLREWRNNIKNEYEKRFKYMMFPDGELGMSIRLDFPSGDETDIDKCTRSVFDALTGTAYKDDRQIKRIREVYVNREATALGARISVWKLKSS